MIGWLLRRFIWVRWERQPGRPSPVVVVSFCGIEVDRMVWNTLGNLWEKPKRQSLWNKLFHK